MAYDRYDTRDERPRWYNDRYSRSRDQERDWGNRERGYSEGDERGFFERAGDEIASWFGDDDAERRRERDERMEGRQSRENRGDYRRDRNFGSSDLSYRDRDRERGYRPITGDYGRGHHESDQFFAASGYGRGEQYAGDRERSRFSSRGQDPHYQSWRQRHVDELDRDYDDYRRENQSRFENDFGSWRERRMQKRGLLVQIREHMEVVGSDDEHVGTVDCVKGDRVILTKSDPESGGAHHSLSCSDVDRIEGDRLILDCSADQARQRWRDESRSRALFERDDQGEMGPRVLDRSFQGTYRD
jgi:hypothetical protein